MRVRCEYRCVEGIRGDKILESDVAVVVCNYNKKEFVLSCIESILAQSYQNRDVYVVDNASTDGSCMALRECYGEQIIVIENPVNSGGSGGFNAGMEMALRRPYRYLVLADNDIRMDAEALGRLHDYMENHEDAGLAGTVILKMDEPETVMALGSRLDKDKYEYHDNFRGAIYNENLPETLECDYVPACTLMVRREVVDKVGLMDESYFLYWDDIDWATRIGKAGYRVVALRDAKVWHKGGGIAAPTTAPIYYFMRNRLYYYSKYLPEEELLRFVQALLKDIFIRMHGCFPKGKKNYIATMVQAYADGLYGVRGRAGQDYILPDTEEHNAFVDLMEKSRSVVFVLDDSLYTCDGWEMLARFAGDLRRRWPKVNCYLSCAQDRLKEVKEHILIYGNVAILEECDTVVTYDHMLVLCEDIREFTGYERNALVVDIRLNFIGSYEDFLYFQSFQVMQNMFYQSKEKYFLNCIKRLRVEAM